MVQLLPGPLRCHSGEHRHGDEHSRVAAVQDNARDAGRSQRQAHLLHDAPRGDIVPQMRRGGNGKILLHIAQPSFFSSAALAAASSAALRAAA